MNAWLVLWGVSTLVQVVGLGIACWNWWSAAHPGWRCFWAVFTVNWVATLVHQSLWSAATELALPMSFLQGLAKLAAMLAEIVVMQVAHDLERPGEGRY